MGIGVVGEELETSVAVDALGPRPRNRVPKRVGGNNAGTEDCRASRANAQHGFRHSPPRESTACRGHVAPSGSTAACWAQQSAAAPATQKCSWTAAVPGKYLRLLVRTQRFARYRMWDSRPNRQTR